jgi:alpha-1,6-mannosyltransferase
MRPRLQVVFLGITNLLLYLFLTKISTEFNWGEGYADRPILTYLGIYFSLSLIFFTACFILSKQSNDRFIFWTMIVFGLLFRFAILPETYYEVYNEKNERELEQLAELKWESATSLKYLERVNHPSVPSIYPPMAQYVFRVVHFFQPDSILAMRVAFLVFDVLALFFIIRILGKLRLNRNMSGVYFWCPLMIKETYNSTHLDIIGISFLFGSIYFLINSRHTLATFFLALGFLGKLYPAILFPLYIQACFEHCKNSEGNLWRTPILNSLLFVGVIILGYVPFMGIGLQIFDGLKAYSLYWQSNDSIFACLLFLFKNLTGDLNNINFLSNSLPVFLSKLTVICVLMGVLIRLLLKNTSLIKDPQTFLKQFFILMALVFLLSPIQNPWYLCWVVPFLCLFPNRALILLTGLVGLYYLDFYFDYQEIQLWSQWIPWLEYLPFYVLLIWDMRNENRALKAGKNNEIA